MEFKDILIKENIKGLIPYPIEDHNYKIKLDANESPFSIDWVKWPEMMEELRKIPLNRYPDPHAKALRKALSRYLDWPADRMILGNGSDELIQYILMVFGDHDLPVYAPHPSFSMYRIIALSMGLEFRKISLEEGFELPISQALIDELSGEPQKILFIPTPNNPTGNAFNRDHVLTLLKNTNGIVCIDEAYRDFSAGDGFLDILPKFDNLIILRTLSKIGMAGLRVGILLGNEGAVEAISKVRLPYNLNAFSQFLALAVMNHHDQLLDMIEKIKKNRSWLQEEMQNIKGIRIFPSQANFVLFTCEGNTDAIFHGLLKEGILIKIFPPEEPWPGLMRVTVGNQNECGTFIRALKKVLSNQGRE
ncbi:MAG: histidinol-phosphate transaminase [bacterium]